MENASYKYAVGAEVYFVEESQPKKGTVLKVFITSEREDDVRYKVSTKGGDYIIPEDALFSTKEELTAHLMAQMETVDEEEEPTNETINNEEE